MVWRPCRTPAHTEPPGRPGNEEGSREDRIARHRTEVAAVLREGPIVTEHVVLVAPQTDRRERRCLDVVGLRPVDEDTPAAADNGVARNADHALLQTSGRVRIGSEHSAELATGGEDDDLPTMRVSETVGEPLG